MNMLRFESMPFWLLRLVMQFHQTPIQTAVELSLLADQVKKDPNLIVKYDYLRCEAISLAAVSQVGQLVARVTDQTEAVCLAAIQNDKYAFLCINRQMRERYSIRKAVIRADPMMLGLIFDPPDELVILAWCLEPDIYRVHDCRAPGVRTAITFIFDEERAIEAFNYTSSSETDEVSSNSEYDTDSE
jgi:hypothetical protein